MMAFAVPSHLAPSSALPDSPSPPSEHLGELLGPLTSQPWLALTASSVRSHRFVIQKDISKTEGELLELITGQYGAVREQLNGTLQVTEQSVQMEQAVSKLEAELDRDPTSSLLPPLLKVATQHASALASHSQTAHSIALLDVLRSTHAAFADLQASPDLSTSVERWNVCAGLLGKEEWEWDGEGDAKGTLRALKEEGDGRLRQERDRLREELSGIWEGCIRVHWSGSERLGVITVQSPEKISWDDLTSCLSTLDALQPLISSLTSRILTRTVEPILSLPAETAFFATPCPARCAQTLAADGKLSIFRVSLDPSTAPSEWETPSSPLSLLQYLLTFLESPASHLPPLPSLSTSIPPLVQSLHLSPALPRLQSTDLPEFAQICQDFSEALGRAGKTDFSEWTEGLPARWVKQRRGAVMGRVRALVEDDRGWDGWIWESERLVEPAVEEPLLSNSVASGSASGAVDDDGDGWGLSSSPDLPSSPLPEPVIVLPPADEEEDDAWGFSPSPPSSPPPSSPTSIAPKPTKEDEADGWGFSSDDDALAQKRPPAPAAPAPRQARKLEKLAAKSRPKESSSPSPSHSPSPSIASPIRTRTASTTSHSSSPSIDRALSPKPKLAKGVMRLGRKPGSVATPSPEEEILAPDAEPRNVAPTGPYIIRESRTVSTRVKLVVEVIEELRMEVKALASISSTPSAPAASARLSRAAPDVLSLVRALIPVTHKRTLSQVPALAMQFVNDCAWLAGEVERLAECEDESAVGAADAKKLRALGHRVFDGEVASQVAAAMETLDEATRFTDTSSETGYKETELAVKRMIYKVELLSKVWKPVLATEQLYMALGTIVSAALTRMLSELLALPDITSRESERLNAICKLVHPLEYVFKESDHIDAPSAVVAFVPEWLKFCYLSEVLEASLADITYLFESGALIDFSVEEVATLIRALFSDTSLRASTIDKVLQGHPAT